GQRFTSRELVSTTYIANVARYIHRNPLDIPRVDSSERYRWSSHRTYLGHRRRPPWLFTEPIRTWFGGVDGFARFVDGAPGDAPDTGIPTDDVTTAIDLVLAERSADTGRSVMARRRAIGLAIATHLPRRDAQRLHAALGIETDSALRSAVHRARLAQSSDPTLAVLTARVAELTRPWARHGPARRVA
ncbi:MAG: hypothetical protein AAGF91_01125, partial [Actinomycetota bacterium]